MKHLARWWLTLGLALVLLLWLLAHHGAPFWHGSGLHPDVVFDLDGQVWQLGGWEPAQGLSGWLGALIALVAVAAVGLVALLVVLPLVLLLGVGLPLLLAAVGVGVAVLAVSGVGVLLFSPLLLLALLLWWLLRPAAPQEQSKELP